MPFLYLIRSEKARQRRSLGIPKICFELLNLAGYFTGMLKSISSGGKHF